MAPRQVTLARVVGVACVVVFVGAAATLLVTGNTDIRYSADHERTIPIWHIWIPALVGIALTRLVPPRLPDVDPMPGTPSNQVRREALICVALAVIFALALPVLGTPVPDGWYLGLKIGLLAVIPSIVLRVGRLWGITDHRHATLGLWYWIGPGAAIGAWFALAYFGPFARSFVGEVSLIAVIGLFLLNSVLEETFYRIWLQTRLESLLGSWTGIAGAALLWAAWHMVIQGTGRPMIDIATVVAYQGVLGLFLGFLWSRYRNPWALFLVHGAINAPLALLLSL